MSPKLAPGVNLIYIRLACSGTIEAPFRNRRQFLSNIEGRTEISNRAFFDVTLIHEHGRAERLKSSLTGMMMDLDDFKLINVTHGHLGRDACLRALARLERSRTQPAGDFLVR